MRIPVLEVIGGTTLKLTWVSSGATPSSIRMSIYDKSETLVSSVAAVSSGNGHYYAPLFVPSSDSWYVARAVAVIDANTYVNKALVKTHRLEVD